MPKITPISGTELIKIAGKLGFFPVRQRGSHVVLRNENRDRAVIPIHPVIKTKTLLGILKELGINREELEELRK